MVDFLEFPAQQPFQVRIDHRQRLVEQHGRHVGTHETASQRNLLLRVHGQAAGAQFQVARQLQHLRHLLHALFHLDFFPAAIAQRKRQVVVHGHGVVDDGKLEHLRDIACFGGQLRHILAVEQHLAMRRFHQAGDDIEQGRLAAAGRPQQGIRAAVMPRHAHGPQRIVGGCRRVRFVGVGQVDQFDARHVTLLLAQGRTAGRRRRQKSARHAAGNTRCRRCRSPGCARRPVAPPGPGRRGAHAHRFPSR